MSSILLMVFPIVLNIIKCTDGIPHSTGDIDLSSFYLGYKMNTRIATLLIITNLITTILSQYYEEKSWRTNERLGGKKSIIPRHASDTKYGALYEVVEPQEVNKRSKFETQGYENSQLHELENFVYGRPSDNAFSLKKSEIERNEMAMSQARNAEANQNIRDSLKQKKMEFLRNIIAQITRENKLADLNGNADDIQQPDIRKKENIEVVNSQVPDQVISNVGGVADVRDNTLYGT